MNIIMMILKKINRLYNLFYIIIKNNKLLMSTAKEIVEKIKALFSTETKQVEDKVVEPTVTEPTTITDPQTEPIVDANLEKITMLENKILEIEKLLTAASDENVKNQILDDCLCPLRLAIPTDMEKNITGINTIFREETNISAIRSAT